MNSSLRALHSKNVKLVTLMLSDVIPEQGQLLVKCLTDKEYGLPKTQEVNRQVMQVSGQGAGV